MLGASFYQNYQLAAYNNQQSPATNGP
jgi:hypothetical protein